MLPLLLLFSTVSGIFTYIFEKKIILGSEANGAFKVNRIINKVYDDEIPVFGSSRAECSFVPSLISNDVFNYGLSGVQDNVTLFFLEEEVKKNKHTPIIVNLDLDGLSYSLAYRSYYLYNSTNPDIKNLLGDDFRWWYNIPFVKYWGYFEQYTGYYLNDKLRVTKKFDRGGNFGLDFHTAKRFQSLIDERIHTPTVLRMTVCWKAHLYNLLTAHPERTFVFVLSPCHWSYFVSLQNVDGLRTSIKQLETYKNVRVFNMSRMPYPDSLYLNTSHLNYEGAKVFSKQLRDSLRTSGIIE